MASADGSSGFDFQLQDIAGSDIYPSQRLNQAAEQRLQVAKRTVDQNYYELDEYIDGNLSTNPIFLCRDENRREEGFEALRLLHNYLASLYSLNETIRVLVNQHTPSSIDVGQGQFTSSRDGATLPYYGRRLSFLRGLRTDFQHGGFSCLTFERTGELGDFGGYHVVFERNAFMNDSGLRSPGRFLQHTNENEQQYPLCFLGQFHQDTVQDFHEETQDWFEAVSD